MVLPKALLPGLLRERIDLIYIPILLNYSALFDPLIYYKFCIPYAIIVTFDEDKLVGACVDEIVQAIYQAVNHNYSMDKLDCEVFHAYPA